MTRRTAILVLGFNRPEFLSQQLQFLTSNNFGNLFASIDCDISGNIDREILEVSKQFNEMVHWNFRRKHLGIGNHLPFAVNELFKNYDNVIILEDDIRISPKVLHSGINLLSKKLPDRIFTIGFFGALPSKKIFHHFFGDNVWRETNFFSSWGWGVQKESWEHYSQFLDSKNLELSLASSQKWKDLRQVSKERWIARFRKVSNYPNLTWDYQMQYATFKEDLVHLLPVYRSADNIGFNDLRSINTKSLKPFWYIGETYTNLVSGHLTNFGFKSKLLQFVDRITWAGDIVLRRPKVLQNLRIR